MVNINNSALQWLKYSLLSFCLMFSVVTVVYPKCFDVQDIDFRNRVYPLSEYGFTEKTKWLRVSEGQYEDRSIATDTAFLYFKIKDVIFGNLTGDSKNEAVVVVNYGSNSGSFFLTDTYIFGCVGGKIKLIDILKQSRVERESKMLVHESIENSVRIRKKVLSVKYKTEGSRPSPEFKTTFRYKILRSRLVKYKSLINRKYVH